MANVFKCVRNMAKSVYYYVTSPYLSVRLTVLQRGTSRLQIDGFSLNLMYFRKSVNKIQLSIIPDKKKCNKGTLHEDQYSIYYHIVQFFLELEMFQTKTVEKI